MSTLFDRTIAESYTELLKTASASGVTSTLTVVEDGDATASALQISTSTVKSSGTLEVVGQAILSSSLSVTGASTLTGNVTMGGDLTVTGNAVIQGTLTANGGTLTLGDADTDNVVFNADVNSHILPNTDNTYDLGSASKSWRNLHLDGTATVNNLSITGSQTVSATTQSTDKDTGALVVEGGVGVEKNVNVGGNLAVTGTTSLTGDTTITGDLAVNGGDLTTTSAAFNLVNANVTSVNFAGAGTAISIGASTGTTTVNHSLTVAGGTGQSFAVSNGTTNQFTVDSTNGNTSVLGTLGVTGATTLSSTLGVTGDSTLSGDLAVNGGDLTTSAATFNLVNTNATTVNAFGAGTTVNIGANTGTTTIRNNAQVNGTIGVTGAALLSSTLGVSDTISATKASGTGLAVTANATVGGDLTVSGNLTINGTTTNINTTNLVVEDKNVILGDVASPTDVTADGGGITLKGATDKTLNWVDATDAWTSSEHLNLVSAKEYRIAGNSVLSANTLGSGVTASSLTSVGTIGTGVWQGTIVDPTYGGTGVNNSGKTITLGGSLTTSGAHTTTLTTTGNTSVTLPTTGTLATLANTETLTNKTINLSNNTLQATSAQIATAVTDETGTGALVFGTSPTLTTPVISSIVNTGTLTLPTSTDTLVGRATTDTLTNKTISLANNTLQATSAEVAAAVTDETGTGSLVFSNSPTLVTPTLGAASATSLTLSNALSVANGGTGRTSMGGANTFLAVDSTNTGFTNKTLSAGTGINISDVANVVTITATGGGGGGGGGSASGAVAIYRYNATASQTVFSGPDASSPSSTLAYTPNYISVYVNGVKLDDSDFTATNGTSVTLSTACVLNDDVDIVAFGAVPQLASPGLANYVVGTDSAGTALQYKQLVAGTGVSIAHGSGSVTISASGASPISAPLAAFRYIASAGQTVFSGVDTNGNTLAFTPGFLYVFVNGVLLAPTLDYTTTSTTTVTLVSGCSLSDFVDILAFGQVTTIGLADSSVTTAKLNDSSVTYAKLASSTKETLTGKSIAMSIVFGG